MGTGASITGVRSRETPDDTALFEELVFRNKDRFYRVAFRMTGNHESAQDLLQEALIEAFKAFSHFRKGSYFDRWLFRIMTRSFIDSKRVKQPVVSRSLDDPAAPGISAIDIPDISFDPASQIETQVIAEPIQQALDSLPAAFRLVLIMSDIEQMTYDEIAEFLNVPVGTVRSRLHRARSIMCSRLVESGFNAPKPAKMI
jgi:RNA polymerase sigma-70 factor (ECF subfamily)